MLLYKKFQVLLCLDNIMKKIIILFIFIYTYCNAQSYQDTIYIDSNKVIIKLGEKVSIKSKHLNKTFDTDGIICADINKDGYRDFKIPYCNEISELFLYNPVSKRFSEIKNFARYRDVKFLKDSMFYTRLYANDYFWSELLKIRDNKLIPYNDIRITIGKGLDESKKPMIIVSKLDGENEIIICQESYDIFKRFKENISNKAKDSVNSNKNHEMNIYKYKDYEDVELDYEEVFLHFFILNYKVQLFRYITCIMTSII